MANRRIEMMEYRQALYRMRLKESDRQINRDTGLGRAKLKLLRAIAEQENWLDSSIALPEEAYLKEAIKAHAQANRQGSAAQRPLMKEDGQHSSVLPYAEIIQGWFNQGVSGQAIYKALVRNQDYRGHYSSVRRYLKHLRVLKPQSTMILEFAPGEACQVDFGAGPLVLDEHSNKMVKTWFFVMTLCFSRHQYVEFVLDQTVETWLNCHHHAFRHFGGVPQKVIIDNPKCAITRAVTDDVLVQRSYAECAEGYGFMISPCPVADPQKKGRVESGVKYIKNNFLPTREFMHLLDMNRQVQQWVMQEAGERTHGSTYEKPLTLYKMEHEHLMALPDVVPDSYTWAKVKVHSDLHIQFQQNLYSVPERWIHTSVMVKAGSGTVDIFNLEFELIASHGRLRQRGQRSTVQAHLPEQAQAWMMQTPQYCLEQAREVGSACLAFVVKLLGDKVLDRLRSVQGLLRLRSRFGDERLEGACVLMQEADVVSVRTLRAMLEKGLDRPATRAQAPRVYQQGGAYYRAAVQTEFNLH
jgi:transposase